MTTRDKRKTASKALRAYFEFMRIDASAKDIIDWMHTNHRRGVDWRGCTKSSMAESWAIHAATESEEFGITTPPFEKLKGEFGLKRQF